MVCITLVITRLHNLDCYYKLLCISCGDIVAESINSVGRNEAFSFELLGENQILRNVFEKLPSTLLWSEQVVNQSITILKY